MSDNKGSPVDPAGSEGRLKLDDPKDLRILIKKWIGEACKNGELPFKKDGGIIVQMLNLWLRSYETSKITDLEERIKFLEEKKAL